MSARAERLKPYPMSELTERREALEARGVRVLDFGAGDPLEATDPAIRAAFVNAVPEVSQYPTVRGRKELREAISRWLAGRFEVMLDPEREILPTNGSKEAVFHLPLVLVDGAQHGQRIVHPVPGYPVMEMGALYAGAERDAVSLTEANAYLMDPRQIEPEVLARARIVWLNYPHNPTGQDLPEELWRAWVEARDEHGFVLCSDECYTEIYFGERPRSLLEFGREGCLVFHSLSKRSGMTGYRSGFVAGDPELIRLYAQSRAAFGVAMPIMTQEASRVAWSDETHVATRRECFALKRDVVLAGLARMGLESFPATSTFYIWVRVPAGETDRSYTGRLLELGLMVSPGSLFGPGNEGWIRLALVPSVATCEDAMQRWATL